MVSQAELFEIRPSLVSGEKAFPSHTPSSYITLQPKASRDDGLRSNPGFSRRCFFTSKNGTLKGGYVFQNLVPYKAPLSFFGLMTPLLSPT